MKTDIKRFKTIVFIFLAISSIALVSISLFSVGILMVDHIIPMFLGGKIDLSYFALLIVALLLSVFGTLCYKQWSLRRSFIYVSVSNSEVRPVDRREEYYELTL